MGGSREDPEFSQFLEMERSPGQTMATAVRAALLRDGYPVKDAGASEQGGTAHPRTRPAESQSVAGPWCAESGAPRPSCENFARLKFRMWFS